MSNEKVKACGHPLDSYSHCWECALIEDAQARQRGRLAVRNGTSDDPPTLPQPKALVDVRAALWAYHHALDTRQDGVAAANLLTDAIQEALGTPWIQGATLAP